MITVWPSRSSAKRAIKKALAGNETERSKCSLPRNQWPSRRRKNYYALRNVHAQRSRLAAAFVPETCPSWKRCKNDRTTLASDMLTRRTYERHDTKPAEDVDSAYSTCGRVHPRGVDRRGARVFYGLAQETGAEETAAESRSHCKKKTSTENGWGSDPGGSLRLEGGLRSTPSFARDQICDSEKMGYVNLG